MLVIKGFRNGNAVKIEEVVKSLNASKIRIAKITDAFAIKITQEEIDLLESALKNAGIDADTYAAPEKVKPAAKHSRQAERNYDNLMNEGGEGYNPHRNGNAKTYKIEPEVVVAEVAVVEAEIENEELITQRDVWVQTIASASTINTIIPHAKPKATGFDNGWRKINYLITGVPSTVSDKDVVALFNRTALNHDAECHTYDYSELEYTKQGQLALSARQRSIAWDNFWAA